MRRLGDGAAVVRLFQHGPLQQHHVVHLARRQGQLRQHRDRGPAERIERPGQVLQPGPADHLLDADQERGRGLHHRPEPDQLSSAMRPVGAVRSRDGGCTLFPVSYTAAGRMMEVGGGYD